jgi:hypothetical protein
MNTILKNIFVIIAIFILSTVAVSGQYIKEPKSREYICNETNTKCDLSQENDILSQALLKKDTDTTEASIRAVYYGKL